MTTLCALRVHVGRLPRLGFGVRSAVGTAVQGHSGVLENPENGWGYTEASKPMLQTTGRYYFQGDPHTLLGMNGHLKVED